MPAPASLRLPACGPRRTVRATLVGALAGVCAAVVLPAMSSPAAAAPTTEGSDITIVQANLLSPQSYQRFQQDATKVLRQSPDLITYNEVAFRNDQFLAPKGYQLWRSPKDRYTKATPVAWRTDQWTAVDKGTRMISDWRGRPPGRTTEIGRRRANWVTLKSPEGRVLSLVSVHVAPRSTGMPDLHERSIRRLCALVEELAPHGPVLVGGDFNVPVGGSRYQHEQYAAAQMKSTYQLLGTRFGTSDHGSGQATIDYIFLRGTDQLKADTHYPVELNSDHDAVVAGLSWKTDAPASTTTVTNDPEGTRTERRAVASAVTGAIRDARSGGLVEVATRGTDLRPVHRALVNAHERGVRVRLTTSSRQLTDRERALARLLAGAPGSGVERCLDDCATQWEQTHPPSTVLVSDGEERARLLVEVTRRLRPSVITRRTRATLSTGEVALEQARTGFSRS